MTDKSSISVEYPDGHGGPLILRVPDGLSRDEAVRQAFALGAIVAVDAGEQPALYRVLVQSSDDSADEAPR